MAVVGVAHRAWWLTTLDKATLLAELEYMGETTLVKTYKLANVPADKVQFLIYHAAWELEDPRAQYRLQYDDGNVTGAIWSLTKMPFHVAKKRPVAAYVDVGNNMVRVFEEVSEFTRRY
ncbi:MAG: hypothetical protein ACTS8S_04895 [Giesbergeria sp.]